MDRRSFLASATAATLSAAMETPARAATAATDAAPQPAVAGAASRKQPNVLVLMSDQHKRSCMGSSGDPVAVTPHLDALAAESVRFTNAYCNNPVCGPSRASLMTGLYSHHVETQDNSTPYSPRHATMAHHFNRAGYLTALIGKMHFVDAQTHGFDYLLDFNDWQQYLGPKTQLYADELAQANSGAGLPEIDDLWREEGDPWKGHRTRDNRQGAVAVGRVSLLAEQDQFEGFVTRESERFLRNFANTGQPFFLISSFLKPHDPFMPAQRFADMFHPDDMKLPPSYGKADKSKLPAEVVSMIERNRPTPELRDPAEARKRMAFYYASLAQMDDCVGRIIGVIKDLNLENDTIICYTSDHGEMLGDLGLWQKFEFYEGSCGVPLLIRVPGNQPGVCDRPVSLVSLSATLTELADVRQIAPNDGVSLTPWLKDPHSTKEQTPVFAEYGLRSRQPKYMIRDGDWKYTWWVHDVAELYNLKTDPEELHNLAAEPAYASRASELQAKLFAWYRPPA